MATNIYVDGFMGMVPQVPEEGLPNNAASLAKNCVLERGLLEPSRSLTTAQVLSKTGPIRSIYRWAGSVDNPGDGYWFHWPEDVWVERGPIESDIEERTYFAGEGITPSMTYSPIAVTGGTNYPENDYDLGLPSPDIAGVTTSKIAITANVEVVDEADPAKATITGHAIPDTAHITFAGTGFADLDGETFEAKNITEDTFDLYSIYDGLPVDRTGLGQVGAVGTVTTTDFLYPLLDAESRAYIITYVTEKGEEGPPSDPTAIVSLAAGMHPQLDSLPVAPAGNYNVTKKRIYRDQGEGAFLFVTEIAVAIGTYEDITEDTALGAEIQTLAYDKALDDLDMIIALPNGVMAGGSKNQLCVSVINRPHAWPALWRRTLNNDIMGVGSLGVTIVAITSTDVYLVDGSDPSALSDDMLNLKQGCVSKRSVSSTPIGVFFASPDGLVMVTGGGVDIVTDGIYTREQWNALQPDQLLTEWHDMRLYCYFPSKTIILDYSKDSKSLIEYDWQVIASYADPKSDRLYVIESSSNQTLKYLSDNIGAGYEWVSKDFLFDEETVMSCARIDAKDYTSITMTIYADDQQIGVYPVTSDRPFRLNLHPRARRISFKLVGTSSVISASVAADMQDLK